MSKWLKQLLFGIWGLLLIPLIAPILEKWLEENVFSDSSGITTTVFSNTMAAAVFSNLLALGQQRWFKFAFVFLQRKMIFVGDFINCGPHQREGSANCPLYVRSPLQVLWSPMAA